MTASEWIPSFSVEYRPQQLVGHLVELASKDGGGWRGTVTEVRGMRLIITDGVTLPWLSDDPCEPFAEESVYTFDVARARIIDKE